MKLLPRVIGLIGPKGSGKSEAANILAQDHGYQRIAFADPLKLMLKALGLSESDLWGQDKETPSALLCGNTPRRAMQTLGTEWGRKLIDETLWATAWQRMVLQGIGKYGAGFRVAVEDMRFVNEEQFARTFTGAQVWWVRRGTGLLGGDVHVSELEWQEIAQDREIPNNGTLDDLAQAIAGALK